MLQKVEAVVDRISEQKYAVIIAESIKRQFDVNTHEIDVPLREGLWVDLYVNDQDEIVRIEPNERLTQERKQQIDAKMTRLRKRKGSKFKST